MAVMNNLVCRLTAVAIVGPSLLGVGQAQLIDVEPGYVKAPFVRVYTYPDGSSYVRAPFVSVFSPGYGPGYFADAQPRPVGPDLAQMDWPALRQTVRKLSTELDSQLTTLATGDTWKTYLKTAEIPLLLSEDRDKAGPPAPDVRETLEEIHRRLEATRGKPEYAMIASLAGFKSFDAALAEFLTPPDVRLRRQLAADGEELHRSLDRLGAEAGWYKYLALPPGIARSPSDDAAQSPPPSPADLTIALQRFDLVAQNDGYGAIAKLPGFEAARKHLAEYAALLNSPAKGRTVEELPAPSKD
jgi:hypothetical protein